MDKNGKQQPTQSSHLGWLKTAFSWLFRTGDHQQEDVCEEKEAADKEPRDVDVLSPIDPDASVGDPELPETSKQQRNPESTCAQDAAVDKGRQNVVPPTDPNASADNPELPQNLKHQRNPETTRMPDENTIVVRDISPIGNEVVNMEVDDDAVEVTTVQEEFERVLVIEDYDVPQISSTLNCWVPGSSTELGVSIANLRRSPPPPYGKLGNMTKIMSPRRTPPNFQIKAGPPLKIYLNPPKLQLTKSPFLDKTRNPQPCGKVLEPTTSALASLRLQNPILEQDENEEGRETNPLLPERATETSFEISLKRKRNVLYFADAQNTPKNDKRVNFENNDADGQLKPKLLLDGHGRDRQGETSAEMTKISDSAAGSEASQSKPATEMEPAEEEIETTRDDTENGSDVDIEIGREAKKQKLQEKIKPSAFICTVCNRSFKTTRALNEHFRTHSGERPYACDQCGKKFAARGAFWNHQQTHTKGRPHKCQFCDFRSIQARSMRAHVKRLHKNL